MARKLVPLEEAAKQLGVTPDELNEMRQRQEIYGYRDGASWKFKPEDVEKLAEERAARSGADSIHLDASSASDDDGDDMVLLSEHEMGQSGPSTSSTVIGKTGQTLPPDDSDIKKAKSKEAAPSASDSDALPIDFGDDLPLDLGGSSSLDLASSHDSNRPESGSDLTLGGGPSVQSEDVFDVNSGDGDSTVNLGGSDVRPDSDVLGSSGVGSDITISPGDSGISLVDPADSGLSLEEPLELSAADDDASSFDLSSSSSSGGSSADSSVDNSDFDSDAVMELKGDDDFLLTPLDESTDEESQDSGSQVIALDSDSHFDDASPTVLGAADAGAGLLEEVSGDSAMGGEQEPLGGGLGGGGQLTGAMTGGMVMAPVREAQYGALAVVGLSGCVLLLGLTGMMMFDLMRNMWSWNGAYSANSFLMDNLLSLFEN